ncbi:hypothetical protein SAMN05428953_10811 [Mesorhizobium muleiense]|uniref:Short chain dehydrogenase n=1 Tax=Mesorhizobium muleiense TaxID=1004279 RepID=A0A1G8VMA9_9HYPH|nr:hypothetical protein SAMN05428953_10811 [Mesorhizobium muleiense]
MSTARPYEGQESPGGMPATTTAPDTATRVTSTPVASALVAPTLATSPARRCWSPRPASGRHLHWLTPRRNAASRCITIQVGENLAKTIRNGGGEVFPVQGDFSFPADVERVVTRSISAGSMAWSTMPPRPRAKAELAEAHCDADLNARSVLTASRQAMPRLKRQGGFIVNTSSIAARNGAGGGAGLYGSARLHPRHGQGTDRLALTRWRRAPSPSMSAIRPRSRPWLPPFRRAAPARRRTASARSSRQPC